MTDQPGFRSVTLKRVFDAASIEALTDIIRATPNGAITRRIWFFYETLTGNQLDLEDAPVVTAVDALDPKAYYTGREKFSARHRVKDNLLGELP